MAAILRTGASTAVALALTASPVGAGPSASGLYGMVRKGPISPVCRVGVPCDAPATVTLVFAHGGRVVASVRSSRQGSYRVALPSGLYEIRSLTRVGLGRRPTPHAVRVRSGRWDRIDLFFDTGIR